MKKPSMLHGAMFALLTAIFFLLLANFFILLTRDDWEIYNAQEHILTGLLIVIFFGYGIVSYYIGSRKKNPK